MILVGRYSSPFVRRVGVSLKLLGFAFEQNPISTITNREAVLAFNPLGRIPALVLDDGEVLIDSAAILDYLDELAGPDRALIPPSGTPRRQVLKLVALATGSMDKALSCFIERSLRPKDKLHQGLLDRFADQALAGLKALEDAAEDGWLWGDRLTQADVSTIAALDFINATWPELIVAGSLPKLQALRARADDLPAFTETRA